MKKYSIVALFLLATVAITAIAAAQEETTYYCYDSTTQSWRVCTPDEAILAQEALKREIPKELTQEEWEAVMKSNQPYWQYYRNPPTGTPSPSATPTLSPTPSPRPTLSEGFRRSMFLPWYPRDTPPVPTPTYSPVNRWLPVLNVTPLMKGLRSLPSSAGLQTACTIDSQCVPAQCCHPSGCVNTLFKPACSGIFCTLECRGPLDCGAGHCGCVEGKCQVVPEFDQACEV